MPSGTTSYGSLIEQWSPSLFLVGGALLAGHAAVQGIEAFTPLTPPTDVFGAAGHLVALVGLVGLYPVIVDRTPAIARTARAVAVVPLMGWIAMTGAQLLAVAGIVPSLNRLLPGALMVLVVGSTIIAYVLFGVATLRADEGSWMVGLLVVAPAVLLVVLLADAAVTVVTALDGVLIAGGLALSMLSLGYRLRTWDRPTGRATPASDVATG